MAKVDPDPTRCTERVPERLCGGLRGDKAPRCKRDVDHTGRHKAQNRLRGVGTTLWEWNTPEEWAVKLERRGTTTDRELIPPPLMVKSWAPKESVTHKTCTCNGLKHKCKKYKGLLR